MIPILFNSLISPESLLPWFLTYFSISIPLDNEFSEVSKVLIIR